MKNLSIWESVQKTDPKFTKQFSAGGNFTSINAVYMVMQATKQFGPIGIGWGYDILEERYDNGAPINLGAENQELIFEKTHTIKICLWFMQDGKKGELIHFGHTPYFYKTKNGGFITDKEAPKKSLTDAVKKALSMLGFSADIFMGMYDDVNYVHERIEEARVNNAVNKVEEQEKINKERIEWLEKQKQLMEESVSLSMLKGIHKTAIRTLDARNDQAGMKAIERVYNSMIEKLQLKEAS